MHQASRHQVNQDFPKAFATEPERINIVWSHRLISLPSEKGNLGAGRGILTFCVRFNGIFLVNSQVSLPATHLICFWLFNFRSDRR